MQHVAAQNHRHDYIELAKGSACDHTRLVQVLDMLKDCCCMPLSGKLCVQNYVKQAF